jgi:hypothetical protein
MPAAKRKYGYISDDDFVCDSDGSYKSKDDDFICNSDDFCTTSDDSYNSDDDWAVDGYQEDDKRFEYNRLKSFDKCDHFDEAMKKQLAKFGFYWTGVDDGVRCHFCNIRVVDWQPEDTAFEEHKKHSPRCPFILAFNDCPRYLRSDTQNF